MCGRYATGVGKSGEAPPEFEVAHAHQILALGAERGVCCRHPPPREACQWIISRRSLMPDAPNTCKCRILLCGIEIGLATAQACRSHETS
jgi:hypothetical protein